MAKRRKKRKARAFHGISTVVTLKKKKPVLDTLKEGAFVLASGIAGGGAGAAIGKHSLVVGIPVTLFGIYKGNKYITSAGLGLCLSNGFQKSAGLNGVEDDINGFDVDQIKERVGTFFQNFSEKLYLPKSTDGVNGSGEDNPSYFVNPYRQAELDMSQLDKIQSQVAQMNGLNDIQREF
jgi:hypothetical protein